jgi:hypothetical protein
VQDLGLTISRALLAQGGSSIVSVCLRRCGPCSPLGPLQSFGSLQSLRSLQPWLVADSLLEAFF